MFYQKKPVVIEAHVFTLEAAPELSRWCGGVFVPVHAGIDEDGQEFIEHPHITIATLEGGMKANVGDWIIKGIKGEFYPCKPDIFAETYIHVSRPEGAAL